jgi:hypothetical protein
VPYKVLSLLQPYASLCVHTLDGKPGLRAIKQYETRSWATSYRGPLLIHASKGKDEDARSLWDILQEDQDLKGSPLDQVLFDALPFGKIVGAVNMENCLNAMSVDFAPDRLDAFLGNYGPGRFAWRFANPRALPARGYQSLWTFEPTPAQSAALLQLATRHSSLATL